MTTQIKNKVDELLKLYELPLEELIKISSEITEQNFDKEIEFCSIISAKTGKCSENCKYCAQSSHYRTDIETHPMVTLEEVKKSALDAMKNGATRFSIVTSGKGPNDEDFKQIVQMTKMLKEMGNVGVCASVGILNKEQVLKLKEAGLERYHHNLNTCRSYHEEICTTHSYEERVETVKLCKQHDISICSGGIIGMGESRRQRVELAVELAELEPDSIPVNILHAIEGTPFEVYKNDIDEEEIIRTLAIFRIANPKAVIRYGGGRAIRLSKEAQELGIKAGVNGLLVGNYLTTTGITPEEDKNLVERAGMKLKS